MATYKVLLVDDEPDILDFLSYNFRKHGFNVFTARDGRAGFECAQSEKPDIIVSDVLMPRWSGIAMCTHLKEESALRDIPVIFLSATSDDMLALSALESGGSRFMSKPVHLSILFDAVHRILERRTVDGD